MCRIAVEMLQQLSYMKYVVKWRGFFLFAADRYKYVDGDLTFTNVINDVGVGADVDVDLPRWRHST